MELPHSFLLVPVMRGFVRYTDLIECRVDLADLWLINLSIKITDENQRRISEVLHDRNS